jgi:hypothetical protein
VFFTYIDPEAMKPIIEEAEKNLYQQGLSGEQFDAALGMTRKFMKPGMMAVSSLFTYTLWGFIISLITSIFIQKKPN